MKNLFKVAKQWQLRKKYTIINSVFVSLTILISICFWSYNASLQNSLKKDIYTDLRNYKILEVFKSANGVGGQDQHQIIRVDVDDDTSLLEQEVSSQDKEYDENSEIYYTEEDLELQKKELFNIEHIVNVSNNYAYWKILESKDLKSLKLDGSVGISPATNASLPEIVLGTNFPDEEGNYLVCPKDFYPDSRILVKKTFSIFDKVNIKNLLNKTIKFHYTSINQTNNYEIAYKIVGFYKNNESYIDENECFATNASLIVIAKNEYSDDIDKDTNVNNIIYQNSFFIEIDKVENLEKTQDLLAELGYVYQPTIYLDDNEIKNIENNVNKYTLLIVLLGFVIIMIVLWKQMEEDKTNYRLLIYLGYKKKDIILIFIFSTLIQLILSLTLTIVFSFILFGLAILGLYIFPLALNKWKLCIDIYPSVFAIIILLLAMIINILVGSIVLKRSLNFNEINNNQCF